MRSRSLNGIRMKMLVSPLSVLLCGNDTRPTTSPSVFYPRSVCYLPPCLFLHIPTETSTSVVFYSLTIPQSQQYHLNNPYWKTFDACVLPLLEKPMDLRRLNELDTSKEVKVEKDDELWQKVAKHQGHVHQQGNY